jgi:DNA-binding GntR family transcriptional regulator
MLPSTLLTAARHRRLSADAHSLSETAYHALKERIVSLDLPPASLVTEAELMEALGVGRTPLREAVQRLAGEALVVILPRRGILVADLNMADLQKIFEVRLELEAYAARLAAQRATPQQVAELEALVARSEAVMRRGDHRELIDLDHQAHRLIVRAAQNEFLEDHLERLYTHVLRMWHVSLHKVGYLREAIAEHRGLAGAICAGDAGRAEALMRAHILGFQREFMAAG